MKIIKDVFPAHIAVAPEGLLEDIYDLHSDPATEGATYVGTSRVVVTDTLVIVAKDGPTGAQIVFQQPYETFLPADESRIITKNGIMLAFKKDSNCGCGSRLRSWNPYKTLNSSKDQ